MKNNKRKSNKTKPRAGWGFPKGERKAHFFVGGTSLCGDLEAYVGPKDTDMRPTKDDCPRCRKLIDAAQVKAG